MRSPHLPRVTLLKHSPLNEDHWHSILISLLRGMAAVVVAASHLRALMYPGFSQVANPPLWFKGLAFATGFAHQAVLVFFIISGWLVGGSLLNKMGQPAALANYAIDRVSRLWTVLIPTFLLTLLFALASGTVAGGGTLDYSPANEYSAAVFVGNLFGLQRVALPFFGGNFALWSLANETWYYLMFPLLVAAWGARRTGVRIGCTAALVLLAAALPHEIVIYFVVWLLGVAFSRVRIDCGAGARAAWLLPLLAVSVACRMMIDNDAFDRTTIVPDLACSLVFLVFLASLQFQASPRSRLAPVVSRFGKFFADFSFSLYVLHLPLLFLLQHVAATRFGLTQLSPHVPQHTAAYALMLAILLLAAYLSYWLFEAQTYRIRRFLKNRLTRGAAPAHPGLRAG